MAHFQGLGQHLLRAVLAGRFGKLLDAQSATARRILSRPRPLKVFGMGVLDVYIAGTWVYGTWYVWKHWAGYWNFGAPAYYVFMRAIIWPIWVALALM